MQLSGLPREGYEWIEYKQGHHLLGQECHSLVALIYRRDLMLIALTPYWGRLVWQWFF
ncbi:hypothetical protein P4S72_04160 [Vibrio sp. PP-XX7]